MTHQPLFSVVTVTLNCADDAVQTAKSVLAQGWADFEYIIKDGGSTDGTVERLEELGLHVTVHPDTGIYDAMNQALDQCHGEFVYFLNAGDTFVGPDVLEQVAAQLDRSAAIVYGELRLHPGNTQTRHPSHISRYYLFRKNMNHQGWLARREIYQKLRFNSSYKYVADQEFFWRVLLDFQLPIQHIPVTLANFSYGGASTRQSSRERLSNERWQLVRSFFSRTEIAIYGLIGLYFLNPLKVRIWYMLHPSVK